MTSEHGAKESAKGFADTINRRAAEFRRFIPPSPDADLTSRFLEVQVRNMIEARLAPKRLLSGVLTMPAASGPPPAPCFIEAAIHDPQRGAPMFEQGDFSVINTATCVGCIQIKPSMANLAKFQDRLRAIAQSYFSRQPPGSVMGVIISDAAPEKKSIVHKVGRIFPAHQFTHPKWCPIFILFSRREGQFAPYFPALEALFANINRVVGAARTTT